MISHSPYIELLLFLLAAAMDLPQDRRKLYQALKEGDHEAFKTFFNHHYDSLYSFLRSRNVSPDAAEDLIQKAFVYIWENRDQIDPERSLRAYLFRIAYTRMINHFTAEQKFVDSEAGVQTETRNPGDDLEYAELKETLDRIIEQLPEKRKMVFQCCFMQEFTYRETAEILDVSVKTVENHMALALRDIRSALEKFRETDKK